MISLAKLSIRRPRTALVGWLAVAVVLSVIGFGIAGSVSPSVTVVPRTQSWKAQQLANREFGPTQLVPILLEGPKAQLDVEGPTLVAALTRRPHTRALSAWDAGAASAGLRPRPTAAMIVVSVDRSEADAVKYDQPQIETLLAHQISAPVRAYVTGQPSIDRALRNASLDKLREDELIAVGILFVLLVIGLRAPVAALLVTVVGGVSMLAAFGEVALLGKVMKIDPVGVALGTMTGLALGVGLALPILDRFHRERPAGNGDPRLAAAAAVRELETNGKAVLVGGSALVLALVLVALVGPSQLMVSLGIGMLTCAAFATGGAVVVMPAAFVLLGHRIDCYRFPALPGIHRGWAHLNHGGHWVVRHAVYAGFAATVLLCAIAVPALALNSGPPDVSQLPAHAKARVAFEEISRVMGPGWATPYNLIVVANKGPITDPAMLAAVNTLQRQVAKDQAVASVTGPGQIDATAKQLSRFWPGIQKSAKISDKSKKDLKKLIDGLGQAGAGSAQLQAGLRQAVSGAAALHGGSGQARVGASALHAGLITASNGSSQLSGGLTTALSGAAALQEGASAALAGAEQLNQGLGLAAGPVKSGLPAVGAMSQTAATTWSELKALTTQAGTAAGAITAAISALRPSNDPHAAAALRQLEAAQQNAGTVSNGLATATNNAATVAFLTAGMKAQVNQLAPGLAQLQSGAGQLQTGIQQLQSGNARLADGISQLSGGGGQLKSGLGLLSSGAGQLEAGLVLLDAGTGQLLDGLTPAPGGAGQLVSGLGQMEAAVVKARGQIPSTAQLKQLQKQSPGLFSSGYFVLAAVDGAQAADRNAATFTVNLLQGGDAGQIVVVSKYRDSDSRTIDLGNRLASLGRTFGARNGAQVAVGGPAANVIDMTTVAKSKIWVDVMVISIALLVVLALALRALLLPAVVTVVSLLVAGASFGVLQMLFGDSDPLLGGPGYLDPMTIIGIFTVVFSVSVIFAALLLMRTREAIVHEGLDPRSAVIVGLHETAAGTTGAGLAMAAALIPFATSQLINVRQFGIGVATAIVLEILLVRSVLLPAAETVLGRWGWWPTRGPRPSEPRPSAPAPVTRRLTRVRAAHRPRPRPAHQ